MFRPAAGGGVAPPPLLWFPRSLSDAEMESPRLLPATGTRQSEGAGIPAGGSRVHGGPDPWAGQVPARRLLLLRGLQDGGPERGCEEARAASRGSGPSPLAPRPDYAGGGGGSGDGDDLFLVLLDPVGGDVETSEARQASGPVGREEAQSGPQLQKGESGGNPLGRPALGPHCQSAVPAPPPAQAPTPVPAAGLGPAMAFASTITIHNQNLLLRFENGVLTLATPPPPAWEPGVAPAPQPGGLMTPQAGIPHAAQPSDCPELPPDLLLAEPAEPVSAPAPEEEAESQLAAQSPRRPLGPGPGVVLYLCPEAQLSSTLAGNLPANNNNSLGQAVDPRTLMATSDLPQSLDTSLFFGTTASGFQQSPLDMDDASSLSVGPLASLGPLAMKNSSQEPQALTPSSKLTVDTDALTPSSTLCENSVSELLMPTKAEWNVHPDSDFFGQEEETQFGFSNPAGNHGSQKETDLITVTGSSFLV
uniref:zinc finger X-linked protein ZXDB-like n=1 Tax=Panthera onca TaxID=9690 RepID=UPI002953731B|nr:zinc finger X-linked protein ZXDB-like [Panthera onca]